VLVEQKMLTRDRDLLVFVLAFSWSLLFLSKLGFLFDVQGLVRRSWLWKTKIYVWQCRSCVQFRCRWQEIIREDSRLQNASFNQLKIIASWSPDILWLQWCKRRRCRGCKRTPKIFGLSQIREKSLKILQKNGAQHLQEHTKTR